MDRVTSAVTSYLKEEPPVFRVGDTVDVSVRIREEPQSGRTHVEAMEILRGHPSVEALRPAEKGFEVLLKPDCTDVSVISQDLSVRGFRLEHFAEQSVDLEEVFLHVTKGTVS